MHPNYSREICNSICDCIFFPLINIKFESTLYYITYRDNLRIKRFESLTSNVSVPHYG